MKKPAKPKRKVKRGKKKASTPYFTSYVEVKDENSVVDVPDPDLSAIVTEKDVTPPPQPSIWRKFLAWMFGEDAKDLTRG